jgi:hypothetical protein
MFDRVDMWDHLPACEDTNGTAGQSYDLQSVYRVLVSIPACDSIASVQKCNTVVTSLQLEISKSAIAKFR